VADLESVIMSEKTPRYSVKHNTNTNDDDDDDDKGKGKVVPVL
jgi:hypothetical protein